MSFFKWSKVAATDATADASCPWPEGMAPSQVNDSARGMMAAAAKYRDDIAGAIVTGGTSTAYTATSNQVFAALATDLNGQMISFVPHATNTNAAGVDITLNVDGLGAKPIRARPGIALPDGSLVLGTPYLVTYNHADAVFYLRGMTNPYSIPLGGMIPYVGASAPNSAFALPFGQAVSRATYATMFALTGTLFGAGDTTTTFNLPDIRGRVPAGSDNLGGVAAGRLPGYALSQTGGAATVTLGTANLPPYTPAGVNSGGVYSHPTTPVGGAGGGGISAWQSGADTNVALITQPAFTGTPQGGTSTPIDKLPPTIALNYILRII